MRIISGFLLLLLCNHCLAQDSLKTCIAKRLENPPKIDGIADDSWSKVAGITDFVMNRPVEGGKPSHPTEVKVAYDDHAVYVFAIMYDDQPDSILHELGNRDDDGLNADFFRFVIDPYNLRQDAYDFGVYASGVQADLKFSDQTFNAVWESAVKITDKGWVAEMRIPYSAIRFPSKDIQEWGFQTTRYVRRTREFDQWALTPSTAANAEVYWGTLKGIDHIVTPVRLSLTPYVSSYLERSPEYTDATNYKYSNTFSYNAGADIKYGIDDRFTLDMTLLPDFGQVQSDNKVKNLSYQETIYNENRSFFKEGTDLFSKYDLFYTRRIGRTPSSFYDVPYIINDGEKIVENPSQVKLLNAVKLSGRTNNGTGIGIFNAVTDNMYATIEDPSGNKRKILTEPLTNYNVFVIDQQLNDFSNLNFINTNVIRSKGQDDANVSCFGYTLADKKNRYATDGYFTLSQKFHKLDPNSSDYNNTLGYKYFIGVRKINGNVQYGVSRQFISSNYDQLDLGYFTISNNINHRGYVTFNWFKPWKSFRDGNVSITIDQSENQLTHKLATFQTSLDFYSTLMSYNSIFGGFGINPVTCYDYYEPRIEGRFNQDDPFLVFLFWNQF
ncbi:MAG: carbohydrate binding family 9 domain-containing protein [Bacteroidetes bacterium]|nr:carbohydrate binding family 9 domain-containing protein [Bacteroidota bacterium]